MDEITRHIRSRPARQQPEWHAAVPVEQVRAELRSRPALIRAGDLWALRSLLSRVVDDEAQVVQSGDCAEDPEECTKGYIARKAGLLDLLAGAMRMATHKPVVRVGRIAGQFAKPRSSPTERVGDLELPVFRGHMVNSPEPDPVSRQPDPRRMLDCYTAAAEAMEHLGWHEPEGQDAIGPRVWTSHEALLLDYEIPLTRRDEEGRLFISSTHWPWIGERTNQVDGAHVALLAEVVNPVSLKVGPTMEPGTLLRLCERLDPHREKGRLTLISRMGADTVLRRLPPLVAAVRAAGHPAIWLCDPMHGNTVTTGEGLKTRYLEVLQREIHNFQCAVRTQGGIAGGLHLETTPDEVTECCTTSADEGRVGDKYTSFCDPRLNPHQAISAISAWQG
ncbi:3-deoxy-7-phosphoheptulonate synthase [Streptomyces litchfieldiae]|uniref:Phospho-2-dehydro-3-deoxyheptonate aldolase n=1 Tax=Streptomyces litchfieldiae TaxID=3075543 RepID=A0ABU2MWG1_9ACTN|nr:3-deoxy-7-phosphoheptulonate synthase [Streptomyces sp. DSM 44938]MDT0345811.1 3-deoxy-7-phosphoheptulonate synthase [Streptomyces sp. DSM 44938]